MQTWLDYFENNRINRMAVPWEKGIHVEPHLLNPLVRSLGKFQLGESGEGNRLKHHARKTGNATYAAAIERFISEEQEHSRLMGKILVQLQVPLLKSHWSDWCFVWLRRLFGLHQELMVLLLPEMIAKYFFRALQNGTRDEVLRTVFAQIAQDEDGHLAFHIEYLREAFKHHSFTRKIVTLILWRIAFRVTCLVVILDHRSVLQAVGVSSNEFWNQCGAIFDEVATGIFSPAHVLAATKFSTMRVS